MDYCNRLEHELPPLPWPQPLRVQATELLDDLEEDGRLFYSGNGKSFRAKRVLLDFLSFMADCGVEVYRNQNGQLMLGTKR